MQPTKDRNLSSILFSHGSENILIDCGEGTQRQFRKAKISPAKITRILLTHWHGDHVLGLPGLLSTLQWSEYQGTLEIYGPKGTKNYFHKMFQGFDNNLTLPVNITEISSGKFIETKDFYIEAHRVDHSAPCLAYNFIEKDRRNIKVNYIKKFGLKNNPILRKLSEGKNITYKGKKILAKNATVLTKGKKVSVILDTRYNSNLIKIAKNADILIGESTHLNELKEKSEKYKHLTVKQTSEVAKRANVKKLILTHFSQRYKDTNVIEKEAKAVFKNIIISKDLMEVLL